MGKQRKKPPKTSDPGKDSSAEDVAAAVMKQQAVSALRMFKADADRLGGESPDVVAALGYWIGYPLFLEWIGYDRDWSARQETVSAYHALNHVHTLATRFLMKEAAKRGLDPHAL